MRGRGGGKRKERRGREEEGEVSEGSEGGREIGGWGRCGKGSLEQLQDGQYNIVDVAEPGGL